MFDSLVIKGGSQKLEEKKKRESINSFYFIFYFRFLESPIYIQGVLLVLKEIQNDDLLGY
jgi:hypothetical protein